MNEKFEVLQAMNMLAKMCNNEGFYYNHWIYIIPDDADAEELMDIADNCPDTFNDAVQCFIKHFHKYAQDGGLIIGDLVWPR